MPILKPLPITMEIIILYCTKTQFLVSAKTNKNAAADDDANLLLISVVYCINFDYNIILLLDEYSFFSNGDGLVLSRNCCCCTTTQKKKQHTRHQKEFSLCYNVVVVVYLRRRWTLLNRFISSLLLHFFRRRIS